MIAPAIIKPDKDAVRIGDLYRTGKESLVDFGQAIR